MTEDIKKSLAKEMGPADWPLLEPHFERESLVFVDHSLDLLEVAEKMHQDDTDYIKKLMTDLKLYKVDQTNVKQVREQSKVFSCVVVAPFVLIKP